MGKQVSQYDKILKENIEAVIPSLMHNVLGIRAVVAEELPDDVQHTKERKPDVLKKITDDTGDTFVLQIEFQVADEPDMVYRMAAYYVMLKRKYRLPIRQFVIYLGAAQPQMPTRLDSPFLTFHFPLVAFTQLDYQTFLRSDRPEEVVLSVLADFEGTSKEAALQQIVQRIEETTDSDFALRRYIKQLRVLAQLRKLEVKLKTVMDSIAPFISEEKDALYLRGLDKGEEKIIANLLQKLDYSIEQIADIAGVSVDLVKRVKKQLLAGR